MAPQGLTSVAVLFSTYLFIQSYAFISMPRPGRQNFSQLWEDAARNSMSFLRHPQQQHRWTTRLFLAAPSINLDSKDPFEILNLSPDPSLDKKEIKRAYKRMAVKYHPDVVSNSQSTTEEKRRANDVFAKINWAYGTLMGKGSGSTTTTTGTSTSTTSGAGAAGYTPPHRRTGSYAGSGRSTRTTTEPSSWSSVDWRDYMPQYEDEEVYDEDGDSFGAIFSDLFAGAAVGAAGAASGGGVFRDFVEFLERNVDGYSSSDNEDPQLNILLTMGSFEEIANEMDDTELIVQQLSSKLDDTEKEIIMVTADVKVTTDRYLEKLELEEKLAELQARKQVVVGYVKKARKRLVKLQTRYKQMIVEGRGGRQAYDPGSSSRSTTSRWSAPSYGSTSSSSSYTSSSDRDGDGRTESSTSGSGGEGSWKREGFGSYGHRGSSRGRGSSRRRSARTRTSGSESQQRETGTRRETASSFSSSTDYDTRRTASSTQPTTRRTAPSPATSGPQVPPHRRTSTAQSQAQEDKRRLREIKVDEEFDKLKKELGL